MMIHKICFSPLKIPFLNVAGKGVHGEMDGKKQLVCVSVSNGGGVVFLCGILHSISISNVHMES